MTDSRMHSIVFMECKFITIVRIDYYCHWNVLHIIDEKRFDWLYLTSVTRKREVLGSLLVTCTKRFSAYFQGWFSQQIHDGCMVCGGHSLVLQHHHPGRQSWSSTSLSPPLIGRERSSALIGRIRRILSRIGLADLSSECPSRLCYCIFSLSYLTNLGQGKKSLPFRFNSRI